MLELAARGDAATRRVIKDAGRAVGRALGDVCNVVNPGAIIVGGDLSAAGESAARRHPRLRRPLRAARGRDGGRGSCASELGARAEVLGALTLVIGDTQRLTSAGLAAIAPKP